MKKLILRVAGLTLLVGSFMLTSCSKSNESLLDEYQKLGQEMVEATKDGDLLKIEKLTKKGTDLEKEIQSRELTDAEKERLAEIQVEISKGVAGAAVDKMNDLFN